MGLIDCLHRDLNMCKLPLCTYYNSYCMEFNSWIVKLCSRWNDFPKYKCFNSTCSHYEHKLFNWTYIRNLRSVSSAFKNQSSNLHFRMFSHCMYISPNTWQKLLFNQGSMTSRQSGALIRLLFKAYLFSKLSKNTAWV